MAKCLAQCDATDHDCRGKCNLSKVLSWGSDAFTALVQCEANHACGTCASARAVRNNASCDSCVAEKCSSEIDAFSKDLAALRLDTCGCAGFFASGVPRCACEDQYGAIGKTNWDRVKECEAGPCQQQCGLVSAGDWSCLGSLEWPRLGPNPVDVGFSLVDLVGRTPLPDFMVSACVDQDASCDPPLASGRTDATGQVHLAVPTDQAPFGYFLAVPDADKYHDAYPRTLRYIGPVRYSSYTTRDSYYASWWITSRQLGDVFTSTLPPENQAPRLPDGGVNHDAGSVLFWLNSCFGDAPGVVLSGLDIPGLSHSPWGYYRGSGVDVNLDQTSANTLGVGFALSGGDPPLRYHLRANLAKDGPLVGRYDVLVRPDAVTLVTVNPTPAEN
jgi:hypothetical protein